MNPQSHWENPSLQTAVSLALVLGGSLLVLAAKLGGVMKHCLLPPLLTALREAPGLCQHFPLPGTFLSFPPASILAVPLSALLPSLLLLSSASNACCPQPCQRCLMRADCLLACPSHPPG